MRVLGPFEIMVLQAVISQRGEGYGMTLRRDIAEKTGNDVSIGAIYTTLSRLEAKNLVGARTGDPTPERGGRGKRFYSVTATGLDALENTRSSMRAILELPAQGAIS